MENAWSLLSREPKEPQGLMTDQFIMKFDRYMDWEKLSANYDFSVDMLRIYSHRVKWCYILKRKLFSEDFLREMVQYFDQGCWGVVSKCQILSQEFIHDFSEKVDWENVLLYQNVNMKFIEKHKKYMEKDTFQ